MTKFKIFILFSLILTIFSCGKDNNRPNVPYAAVNRQLNLNDPLYSDLKIMGGHVYLNDGARGVIVIRDYFDNIHALERNCTYNSQEQCAQVTVEKSRNSIRCGHYENNTEWVACCNSKFNLDGTILEGPAQYALYRYNVNQSGDVIYISN